MSGAGLNPFRGAFPCPYSTWQPLEVSKDTPRHTPIKPRNGSPSGQIESSGGWGLLTPFAWLFSVTIGRLWTSGSTAQLDKINNDWDKANLPERLALIYNMRTVKIDSGVTRSALTDKMVQMYLALDSRVKGELKEYFGGEFDSATFVHHFIMFGNHDKCTSGVALREPRTTVGLFADYCETYVEYVYPQAEAFLRDFSSAAPRERWFQLYLVLNTPLRKGDDPKDTKAAFKACYLELKGEERQAIRDAYCKLNSSISASNTSYVDNQIWRQEVDYLRGLVVSMFTGRMVLEQIQEAQNKYRGAHVQILLELLEESNEEAYQGLLTTEIKVWLEGSTTMGSSAVGKILEEGFETRLRTYLERRKASAKALEEQRPFLRALPLGILARNYVSIYLKTIV